MTRNAHAKERRPTLCHASARTEPAVETQTVRTRKRDRADNFSVHGESNAESRAAGARYEAHALDFLRSQRLTLVARNVHCRRGELDLVMRERDGTLVFVEVRARTSRGYGGAAASVGWRKQQRVVSAARYFLAVHAFGRGANGSENGGARAMPACRFDVIAFERGRLTWIRDAFRADHS